MKQYDEENEKYWEVNFFDSKEELMDMYGNTDDESHIEILKSKAKKKGYDTIEIIEISKNTKRFNF